MGTERARLGSFRGFNTERARLGTFRGLCTERARLGTFGGLNLNKTPFKRLGYTEKNFEILTQNEQKPGQRFFFESFGRKSKKRTE